MNAHKNPSRAVSKVNVGCLSGEFPSREFAYSATTLQRATSVAKAFGAFKPVSEEGKELKSGSVKVTHEIRFAAVQAIADSLAESARNGSLHVPAVLCASRSKNPVTFSGGLVESAKRLDLDEAYLIVLDHPDFLKTLSDAVSQMKAGKQISEVLPGEVALQSVSSLYKANTIGGNVEKSQPFVALVSYYDMGKAEDY